MSLIRVLDKMSITSYCRQPNPRNISWMIISLMLSLFLLSCNSKKYLKEDQSFLFANKTSIKSKHKVQNKSLLYEGLISNYQQKETKTIFGIPRHTFYYQYIERKKRKPNSKDWTEERLIKNKPVIFDTLKAELTTEDFERYLAAVPTGQPEETDRVPE